MWTEAFNIFLPMEFSDLQKLEVYAVVLHTVAHSNGSNYTLETKSPNFCSAFCLIRISDVHPVFGHSKRKLLIFTWLLFDDVDKQIKFYPMTTLHSFAHLISLLQWILAYSANLILHFFAFFILAVYVQCTSYSVLSCILFIYPFIIVFVLDARVQRLHFQRNKHRKNVDRIKLFLFRTFTVYSIISTPQFLIKHQLFFVPSIFELDENASWCVFFSWLYTVYIICSFSTCVPILASLIDHLLFSTRQCIYC